MSQFDHTTPDMSLRSLLLGISLMSWALWFGATIAVFVFVKHFFKVFPHDVAGTAANAMFNSFAKYELILAGVMLLSSGMMLVSYPTPKAALILGCVVLTAGMAVTVALGLIPIMDSLIDQGKQHSPEFIKLHVKSMIAMALQSGMLVLVGGMLLSSVNQPYRAVREPDLEDADSAFTDKSAGLGRRI